MAENKFMAKMISTYSGREKVLYEKAYKTRKEAEDHLEILEPILRSSLKDNPALPYVKFVVEELPEN